MVSHEDSDFSCPIITKLRDFVVTLRMATLYKILILCVGFALSNNLWAQSHLDPVNVSSQWAQQKNASLLTPKCRCGIVIAPSFENQFGISLSENYDTLTLIEKRPANVTAYLDSTKIKEIPIRKLKIDSDFGKSIADLIDVAVDKAMPTFTAGLDGTMYYFFASNDSIGETWSPKESTNCGVLVEFVDALKQAIQDGSSLSLKDDWWCSIDKLAIAFQNAPPLPPFYFHKEFSKSIAAMPTIEYSASSPLTEEFLFNVFMSYPAEYIKDSTTEDITNIFEDKSIETVFIEFCKSLVEWKEMTPIDYVIVNIIVDNDAEEKYYVISKNNSVFLNFTLPSEKHTLENLKEKSKGCLVRYMLENMMPNNAIQKEVNNK